jgi:hypothetical protein
MAERDLLRKVNKVITCAGRYPVQAHGTELESVFWGGKEAYDLLDALLGTAASNASLNQFEGR